MLRLLLFILLLILVFRIVRNFLRGFFNDEKNYNQKSMKNDYKNIEEANYTEIKEDKKSD